MAEENSAWVMLAGMDEEELRKVEEKSVRSVKKEEGR